MRALLVGIDCYMPNRLPGGSGYGHLRGCVRDVGQVEAFLTNQLRVPAANITKLTASGGGAKPSEPETQWPSYANIVTAIRGLEDAARAGETIYIHYSGHGGRARTIVPDAKGVDGIDEALVPTDIGSDAGNYLRDVELALLLKGLADAGALLTVVLDCCHSGGMTRGRGDAAIRGSRVIDTRARPASRVAAHDTLAQAWRAQLATATRDMGTGGGWLPPVAGYTLLAACRKTEFAYEYAFDGQQRNGALTYWLLDTLGDSNRLLTYRALHSRLVSKVHSQFPAQTPQLQGEAERVVFGSETLLHDYAVNVLEVSGDELRLNAGQAHGLLAKARFAIYPVGTIDFAACQPLAEAVVKKVGAVDAMAAIESRSDEAVIEQGAQAVLLAAPKVRLIKRVALQERDDLPDALDQDAALGDVRAALATQGWVEEADDGRPADMQVVVDERGDYLIWDPGGNALPQLGAVPRANGAEVVVSRLEHLAKHQALVVLENHDRRSALGARLSVELAGWAHEHIAGEPFDAQPFSERGDVSTIEEGQWTELVIRNRWSEALNLCVFDIRPWKAQLIWPADGAAFTVLEAGAEERIQLQGSVPVGFESEVTDLLKVFATLETTDFRWLELADIDQPRGKTRAGGRAPTNALEEVFSWFGESRPRTRDVQPTRSASKGWAAAQVELRVMRPVAG